MDIRRTCGALHSVPASHVLGTVPTEARSDGAVLGDIDDLLQQLAQHEAVLVGADPELVPHVRDIVAHWDSRPVTRLIELLPLLDQLAEIAGASLPPVLPPAT
ncbi:hypothetical protein [Streptomyces sp. NBC_00827]|uniref:hypothetical protein n=1 Tax=Streptomyces sp. NBC_00827 TaxID=2903677 RepID=UPI00386A532A|nr:hypothetical protein OG569_16460 [Streptomyces sp. NBC_00827]